MGRADSTGIRGTLLLALVILCAGAASAAAQDQNNDKDAADIRQALRQQVADWNRGDVEAFMRGYKDSPDTTFIGKSVEHGYASILERHMPSCTDFSQLEVRPLGPGYAVVTGRFHLARTPSGGGDASGTFSLIWEKTVDGWRIILDHTSAD